MPPQNVPAPWAIALALAALTLAGPGMAAEGEDESAPASAFAEDVLAHPWEASGMVFVHVAPQSNGAVSAGVRRGALSLQLLTDTIDVRYAPERAWGRSWGALRVEGYGAGLAFSPWLMGAPAPERALSMSYGGAEGGAIAYLPGGLYVGGEALARGYVFSDLGQTRVAVPEPTLRLGGDLIFGLYRDWVHVFGKAGGDWVGGELAPRVDLRGTLTLKGVVTPILDVWAGRGWGQDVVTLTRVGGVHPFEVPFAGAGWGELWTERYAVARAGVEVGGMGARGGIFADGAALTPEPDLSQEDAAALGISPQALASYESPRRMWGVGVRGRVTWRRMYGAAVLGYAPALERAPGLRPVSLWAGVGWDWRALNRRAEGG